MGIPPVRHHRRALGGRVLAVSALLVVPLIIATSCTSSESTVADPASTALLEVRLGLARDRDGLAAAALSVNDPSNERYGRFLQPDEIAEHFGASQERADKVVRFLTEQGVRAETDRTRGMVKANMTVAQARALFGTTIESGDERDGARFAHAGGSPNVPAELRGDVVEIVGLTATRRDSPVATPGSSTDQVAANPERCAEAGADLDAIHARYGVDRLAARGLRGEGMTVAVPSPDTVDDRALALWVDCLGLAAPKVDATDLDLLGPINPDQELDLDLDTIVATAPALTEIRTIGMDPVGWVGEPYLRAIEDDLTLPDVLSSSETFCERDLAAGDISLAEWVFAAAAAQGMTVVVASGDAGSTGCSPDPATAVEYPASSAWVTAVGGTQAIASDPAGFEAWNQQAQGVATGGGDSASIPRPAWQPDTGAMRRVPDVAYVAAPAGWPPMPVCLAERPCDWHRLGGTSASAPLFGSAVALMKQHARQAGRTPPGFLNPALYRFAAAASPEAVGDVVQGDNDVRGAGCCDARPGHDPATGWGSIDMVALADHLTEIAPTR